MACWANASARCPSTIWRHLLQAVQLGEISAAEVTGLCEADVARVLTVEGSLAARQHIGGTAPAQVKAAVARAKELAAPEDMIFIGGSTYVVAEAL